MGPLSGVKIIELAGIGPGPFCGMLLSDMGQKLLEWIVFPRGKIALMMS